jgi:molybdate transport system ATP-binding protein
MINHASRFTLHFSMTLSVNIKKRLGRHRKSNESRRAPSSAPGEGEANGFLLDVEFAAQPGVTILFGASGSGKTTTLKSIAGILHPDAGRIAIGDKALFDSARAIDLPIRQRGVGYVFQNLALFPHLSARENVEFGMTYPGRHERRDRAIDLLRAFHVEHTADRQPRQISGGEAQRVAFARALASRPRILLLDEPLSAIDEATKLAIISDLKALNRELRLPVIYVTHSREEAMTLGERVMVFERGRIVAEGEPLDIFSAPVRASVARLTGVENIFPGRVVAQNEAGGTMTVEITDASGACQVDVPFGREGVGERVKVAVPSGDILLALAEPHGTSARNRLCGRITMIEDKGARTLASVTSGVLWRASLTRQAVNELGLHPGKQVWLAFKTHSCYLLDE